MAMNLNVYFVSFCISLAFAATILYLIRKRKLKEQYALLWLLMSAIMMVLSLFPSILDRLAVRIGIFYAPSLLYLLSVVAILFILLHLTITVSSLTNRVVVLTQTLGLTEERIQKLEKQVEKAAVVQGLTTAEEEEQGIAIPDFSPSSELHLKRKQSYDQVCPSSLAPDVHGVPPQDPSREEIR
ncbi:DUF2304 domain-containing protein [Paenibacillus polygoni]|uniref:DUF2304 domain-containing protein n=1 Tax=Paenibacillus polygoni TaxID=3050112 RepID=A0ABY8X3Y7_9BACL|nr:DUF2304 domain-containing protein [Paenibacillus polygoni]WIV19879.1 DUF2304 domain-containing protein [Paenibacillus polygoni]